MSSGTLRVTTDPAPTSELRPTTTPGSSAVGADPRQGAHGHAAEAFLVPRTAHGMGIVREHHARADEDVLLDDRQLEKAAGMDARAGAHAIPELEDRARADGRAVSISLSSRIETHWPVCTPAPRTVPA